jgi:hypothetical protein
MALTVLTASPDWHALLHGAHDPAAWGGGRLTACDHGGRASDQAGPRGHAAPAPDDDAGCIITLFGQSPPVWFDVAAVPAFAPWVESMLSAPPAALKIARGSHLHPPTHAPPQA